MKFLRYALSIGASMYVLVYCCVAIIRINFPFSLEWVEWVSIDNVNRVLCGQRLYSAPSLEHVSFSYTPLYYYISAIFTKFFGVRLFALRLVSFISSLGCIYLIFSWVKKESREIFPGIIAASLFAATFRLSGAWLDIARVDSLFLLFVLAALYILRFKATKAWYALAGLLISLAFLTKQTALIIFFPMAIYCFFLRRNLSFAFLSSAILVTSVGILVLEAINGSWFFYFAFLIPAKWPVLKNYLLDFWSQDIIYSLPVAFIISIWYLLMQGLRKDRQSLFFYSLFTLGMVSASWICRLKYGYYNDLMPAYALISILFGLGACLAIGQSGLFKGKRRKINEALVYLLCIVQFLILLYNPSYLVPDKKRLKIGNDLVETISFAQGEVFVPSYGYLSAMASKPTYLHWATVDSIALAGESNVLKKVTGEIAQALQRHKFSLVVVDGYVKDSFSNVLIKYYRLVSNRPAPGLCGDYMVFVPKNDKY